MTDQGFRLSLKGNVYKVLKTWLIGDIEFRPGTVITLTDTDEEYHGFYICRVELSPGSSLPSVYYYKGNTNYVRAPGNMFTEAYVRDQITILTDSSNQPYKNGTNDICVFCHSKTEPASWGFFNTRNKICPKCKK